MGQYRDNEHREDTSLFSIEYQPGFEKTSLVGFLSNLKEPIVKPVKGRSGFTGLRTSNVLTKRDNNCLSNDIESQFDNVWVPNSFVHAESVIDALCPAGPNESQKDFDIALSSASLNYLKGT